MRLYNLTTDRRRVLDAIEAAVDEHGEVDDAALLAALNALEGDLATKADGIGFVLAELGASADALVREEQRLRKRRQAIERADERLRDYVKLAMLAGDVRKLEGSVRSFSLVQNPPSVVVDDLAAVPRALVRVVTSVEPNKVAIRAAIESGESVPGARLVPGEKGLRVR